MAGNGGMIEKKQTKKGKNPPTRSLNALNLLSYMPF
jgi:hypothetical protein